MEFNNMQSPLVAGDADRLSYLLHNVKLENL